MEIINSEDGMCGDGDEMSNFLAVLTMSMTRPQFLTASGPMCIRVTDTAALRASRFNFLSLLAAALHLTKIFISGLSLKMPSRSIIT